MEHRSTFNFFFKMCFTLNCTVKIGTFFTDGAFLAHESRKKICASLFGVQINLTLKYLQKVNTVEYRFPKKINFQKYLKFVVCLKTTTEFMYVFFLSRPA